MPYQSEKETHEPEIRTVGIRKQTINLDNFGDWIGKLRQFLPTQLVWSQRQIDE